MNTWQKIQRNCRNSFSIVTLLTSFLSSGCGIQAAKTHYILAEKLWTDKKYAAAVSEFEKVIAKDSKGKLGQQALYRAAMTQFLFLGQYADAVRKFQNYIEISGDPQLIWEAQVNLGEILFSRTEQYDVAIQHYQELIRKYPKAPEASEFQYRIGKSYYYLFRFKEALAAFDELSKKQPSGPWTEKASYEMGVTLFTQGEHNSGDRNKYQEAIRSYEHFIKTYPKSGLVTQARFGIASCLEELERLEDAYQAYLALQKDYPSPQIIAIKVGRIRERLTHKSQ